MENRVRGHSDGHGFKITRWGWGQRGQGHLFKWTESANLSSF